MYLYYSITRDPRKDPNPFLGLPPNESSYMPHCSPSCVPSLLQPRLSVVRLITYLGARTLQLSVRVRS